MRIVSMIVMAGVLLLVACGKDSPKPAPVVATAGPGPKLIKADPKLLLLTDKELPPGAWQTREGTAASLQFNRSFDRDPGDPGLATGTTRFDLNARIFQNSPDAGNDFAQECTG